eukprot:CAMPEP_0119139538 /NCGR_PEP_ID=MMETSP1310-20130426/27680_1 /TAXON_ID=464262 /ORGANISM="Genus nov. species nov., Strain RCC2339" /LENGTH=90 /DNA_ID=CAMNT_0007130847 /DNA_START=17 /DNA_END=285 /DNA_ORIENTATION=+
MASNGGDGGDILSDKTVQSMRIARVFHDNKARVNSLDFFRDGKTLITSSDDESMHLYNCESGELMQTILSKKYGVSHVRFTHHNNNVICA